MVAVFFFFLSFVVIVLTVCGSRHQEKVVAGGWENGRKENKPCVSGSVVGSLRQLSPAILTGEGD